MSATFIELVSSLTPAPEVIPPGSGSSWGQGYIGVSWVIPRVQGQLGVRVRSGLVFGGRVRGECYFNQLSLITPGVIWRSGLGYGQG